MSELTDKFDDIQTRMDEAEAKRKRARAMNDPIFNAGMILAIQASSSDMPYLLDLARKQQAVIEALSQWAGRNKTGYYDEAQDDVVQIIRPALEAKP